MSFEDFRRNIEVSSDPALIERWKEEARTTTTINTKEETPVALQSVAEARQHFRQHHLDALLRTGTTLSVHGSVARTLPEPAMMNAIREAHDRELRYPANFVQHLRQGLQNAGLHIFKHRKRVVYVSLARPTPFVARGAVSENVTTILETIAQSPLCTRKALAERVLARSVLPGGAPATPASTPEASAVTAPVAETVEAAPSEVVPASTLAPEAIAPAAEDPQAKAKAALAADLRFLVQSGHIIEFHNGTFDLPLPPKPKEGPAARKPAAGGKPTEAREDITEVDDDEPTPSLTDAAETEEIADTPTAGSEEIAPSSVSSEEVSPVVAEADSVESAETATPQEPASVETVAEHRDEKPIEPLVS